MIQIVHDVLVMGNEPRIHLRHGMCLQIFSIYSFSKQLKRLDFNTSIGIIGYANSEYDIANYIWYKFVVVRE